LSLSSLPGRLESALGTPPDVFLIGNSPIPFSSPGGLGGSNSACKVDVEGTTPPPEYLLTDETLQTFEKDVAIYDDFVSKLCESANSDR